MSFEYDIENALNWINTIDDENKRNSYLIAVNQIYDVRLRYFKRNKTNKRLDTNLTNIKKELRQYIKGNYVNIDLKNSQPFLLIDLLEKIKIIIDYFYKKNLHFNDKTINSILSKGYIPLCSNNDLIYLIKYFGLQCFKSLLLIRKKYNFFFFTNLSNYKKSVIIGDFYNEFINEFNNVSRDKVKEIMFTVLYSQNEITENFRNRVPYQKEKKIFASKYPVIYEIIKALKAKEHNKLAIYLQRLESNLFIDITAKALVENEIIPYTIHDSFLIPAEYKDEALNIIKSVFQKEIGIVPAFHIETL